MTEIRGDAPQGPVLCLGEVVWDLLPGGAVPGGAPFNAAIHLARAGVPVALLSAVGRDDLGARALAFLDREGVPGARIHPSRATGTVAVTLDPRGVPTFAIREGCAWADLAGASPRPGGGIPSRPRVLVFGGVAMHAPGNRHLAGSLEAGIRLCDLNLRPGWSDPAVVRWCLHQAQILKVNQEEMAQLLAWEGTGDEAAFLARHGLRGLCVTLGPGGLRWRDPHGACLTLAAADPSAAGPLVDTVGAGDAITAAMAMGLLRGEAPEAFLERGRLWAARTCAVRGALPPPLPAQDLPQPSGEVPFRGVRR